MHELKIALNYFATDTIILHKKDKGNYVDGKWSQKKIGEKKIRCSVQPIATTGGSVKLNDMPEGIRDEVKFIIDAQDFLHNDDVVTFSGDKYRVLHEWPSASGTYHRVAIGRLKDEN